MVMWSDWLEAIASGMGTTTSQAGVVISLIFIIGISVFIIIATRGRKSGLTVGLSSFLGLILFTFIGWLPLFTGSVLSIIVALILARSIAGWFNVG